MIHYKPTPHSPSLNIIIILNDWYFPSSSFYLSIWNNYYIKSWKIWILDIIKYKLNFKNFIKIEEIHEL